MATVKRASRNTAEQRSSPAVDRDWLRRMYREERDKRLRPDGNDQYIDMSGEYAKYIEDPHVEGCLGREPLSDLVDVVVVGGGFGGLLTGARLRETGITSGVRLIEKGGDFGGTWYWNRYPGAMCDVESYVYLPLLEEIGYVPKEKYAHAPEILAHSRAIGEHYDLYRDALFQTEVIELRWDDTSDRWIVSTNRGDAIRARFVVTASGPLHRPKLPGIPGIKSFKGHSFHTSRWDYAYTGGTCEGNLTGLTGKRVGVIGTGATAVQVVPQVGKWAEHLYVFQRTPSGVDVRGNRPTDPEWAASLPPGWSKRRKENFTNLLSGVPEPEDLVGDGWTDIVARMMARVRNADAEGLTPEGLAEMMEMADFEKMDQIRARVDSIVEDKSTAEALKPYYRQFCKRPCFHDEYLQTFNRPNVHLVDTNGKGVEGLTEHGVIANGREYEVDCLIFATGFEVGTSYTRRAGYEIIGREGRTLTDHWAEGLRTLHGLTSHGFPNCFFLGFTQTAITISVPQALNEQADHVAYMVSQARKTGARVLEPTPEAEEAYVEEVRGLARLGQRFYTECTPGYYNSEGAVGNRSGFFSDMYGAGPLKFFEVLAAWRDDGTLPGVELR